MAAANGSVRAIAFSSRPPTDDNTFPYLRALVVACSVIDARRRERQKKLRVRRTLFVVLTGDTRMTEKLANRVSEGRKVKDMKGTGVPEWRPSQLSLGKS